MSKLTDLQLKSNRMLYPGNVSTFQWYFTGAHACSGILRKSRSLSATEPIFPFFSPCDLHVEKAIASSSMVPIGKNIHICFADSLFNKI